MLLIGGGVLAAAGIAVAAGSGGGDDGGSSAAPPTTVPAGPVIRSETFTGALGLEHWCREFRIAVEGEGPLDATVNWNEDNMVLGLELYDNPDWEGESIYSNLVSPTSSNLHAGVFPGTWLLVLCHLDSPCVSEHEVTGGDCPASYELVVSHP
jgi:hypothetical protein